MHYILQRIKDELGFLKGNILVLVVSWLFFRFAAYLHSPFDSLYYEFLGATPTIIGLLFAINSISMTFTEIIGGYIADYFGRKRIIAIMTYGVGFSYIFLIIAPSWEFAIISSFVHGFCAGLYFPALSAIIADSLPPERRGRGYAIINTIPSLSAIFSPTIAGYILELYGLNIGMRIVYLITLLCVLSAATIRLFFLRETLHLKHSPKEGLDIGRIVKEAFTKTFISWTNIRGNILILTLCSITLLPSNILFHSFVVLYVVDVIGLKKIEWGYINTLTLIVNTILGFFVGVIVEKLGEKRSMTLSLSLSSFAILLLIYSTNFIQVMIAMLITIIFSIMYSSAFLALRANITPRELRGRIFGFMSIIQMVLATPISLTCGFLYELNAQMPFIIAFICKVLTLALVLQIKKQVTIYK